MHKPPKKKVVRHSPPLRITLPPLTKALGRAQADARGLSYSKHIRDLIEGYQPDKPDKKKGGNG